MEYNFKDFAKFPLSFEVSSADAFYGSSFLGGEYTRIHFFWHYLANKILTIVCNIVINLNLNDKEAGYKDIRTNKILDLDLRENLFGIEPEITIKLAKKIVNFLRF